VEHALVQFEIKIRCGGEVKWAGHVDNRPVYYGGPPPETGEWKLCTGKIKDYFNATLTEKSYGESIDMFVLGFEIADLEGWGELFNSSSRYTSYRPNMKLMLSVGQINWPDVKDLSAQEQFKIFGEVLLQSIARVAEMKRKPRDFDSAAFSLDMEHLLAQCPLAKVET
jgi:hypothetical protein